MDETISSPDQTKKPDQKKNSQWALFNWKLSPEELERQVREYHTLPIHKSSRGVAVLIIAAALVLTFALLAFSAIDQDATGTIVGNIIYLILALLIYFRGSRFAIVAVMVLWTGDKLYQIAQGYYSISIFFWWIVLMAPLYAALQVENARRKRLSNQ